MENAKQMKANLSFLLKALKVALKTELTQYTK